jgi:hypothetical protein
MTANTMAQRKRTTNNYLPLASTWVFPRFVFGAIRVVQVFRFLCCSVMCLYVYRSVLWCPLRFPHKNDVQFIFTSSCLLEDSCCIYLQLFVGGLMLYLPPVVCWRTLVVFTSSCLLEDSCCIYLQLFVGGLMLYLPPVVCWRAHVVFTSSCLLEDSCCIVLCVFLYL